MMKTVLLIAFVLSCMWLAPAFAQYLNPTPGGGYVASPMMGGTLGNTYINPVPGTGSYAISPMQGGTIGNDYINPTPNGGYVISPMLGGTLPNAFDGDD